MQGTRQLPAPQPRPAAVRRVAFCALLALLAAPRLVRLWYPQVWIEDESYLNGAFMLARGWLPYRDFPLPHFPVLEALLAVVFLVAPIGIRTAEILTQAAAFGGSVLVFLLGRDLERRGAAPAHTSTAAAIVFAFSPLLFRYHVFEREVFVVPAVVAAVWIIARLKPRATSGSRAPSAPFDRSLAGAGALFALAMAIKLTAVAALVASVAHLAATRRTHAAAVVAGTALGLIAAAALAVTAAFGVDFLVQVVLFRAVHASFPSLGTKLDEMRYTLDVSLAVGGAGVALLFWTGAWRRWGAPLLQLASGAAFLVLLNPTYWAHTGIELLPWLALPAGYLVASVAGLVAPRRARAPRPPRARILACAAAAAGLLATVVPLRNLNWEAGDGSPWGFGYRDRSEIAAAAAYVRAHSASDALVATPPIIAFAANRREVIPYAEVAGEMDELATGVRRDGWLTTLGREAARGRSFWDSVRASRDRRQPTLAQALASHTAAVVINDSPDDLFPFPMIGVEQETLEADGYRLGAVWAHYEAWVPPSGR